MADYLSRDAVNKPILDCLSLVFSSTIENGDIFHSYLHHFTDSRTIPALYHLSDSDDDLFHDDIDFVKYGIKPIAEDADDETYDVSRRIDRRSK